MTGSRVFQFVLLISFVIFSTHALHVLLTDGKGKFGFKYDTGIDVRVDENGTRRYNGCVINNTYSAEPATVKVIVYIRSHSVMLRTILRHKCTPKRLAIAETLSKYNYELLYFGIGNFSLGDERFIAEFLLRTVEPNPCLEHFQIDTIGENPFNLTYPLPLYDLIRYQEEQDVFGGNLIGELRSMDEGTRYGHR